MVRLELHCYGYGCCEARFPEVDAHHRFDGGEVITQSLDDGSVSFEVPADAASLEMWFSAPGFELRTWYCGCDAACAQRNRDAAQFRWVERQAWDSHYEQNYDFEVGGWPVVHGEDVKLIEARRVDGVVSGEIEVRDLAWHKQVRLHWTVVGEAGEWHTSDAAFAGMSEGGEFERWSFAIDDAHDAHDAHDAAIAEGELRFAVRYDVDGRTLWDNDCGADYALADTGDAVVGRACE